MKNVRVTRLCLTKTWDWFRVVCLVCLIALTLAVRFSHAAECGAYEAVLQAANSVHSRHPDSKLMEFSGADAQKIMDVINAVEPVTDFKTDKFLVLEIPEQNIVAFGYMYNGCFRGPSQSNLNEWHTLQDRAFKSGK